MDRFQRIAMERVNALFEQAENANSQGRADRYVDIARRIAMKCRIKIPAPLQRRFCKHCHVFFRRGENVRIRTREGKVVYYCRRCRKYTRIPMARHHSR